MQMRPLKRTLSSFLALAVFTFITSFSASGSLVSDPELAQTGLQEPRGMALHPVSGDLYVCEEAGNRISIIRDGTAIAVIEGGWKWQTRIPSWAIHSGKSRSMLVRNQLQSPISCAFTKEGHLLVTENNPTARVLEFIPDENGAFTTARYIAVPWLKRDFAWQAITAASDGRLFIAGTTYSMGPGLHFGTVLMRDVEKDWWVIDYGPFNSFNALALSQEEDILVILDEFSGVVTWWDTVRQKVIGSSTAQLPGASSMGLLPDGSILVGHDDPRHPGMSRLVRFNPDSMRSELLAAGIPQPDTLLYDAASDNLVVSCPANNSLNRMISEQPFRSGHYLLSRSLYNFEMSQGIAPKKWPGFLKDFVKKLGVMPTDETEITEGQDPEAKEETTTFTVREFTQKIPMIAGRVKVVGEDIMQESSDPVDQIDFVVFYPGRAVEMGPNATPSLSLFSARHESGQVKRTKVIRGYQSMSFTARDGWKDESEQAFLYFPMASCTATRQPNGVDVTLAFLGMGFSEDFYLDLECGKHDSGKLVIDGQNGTLSETEVQFTEMDETGDEVRNIMIAGMNLEPQETYTWQKIGKKPAGFQMNLSEHKTWTSFRTAQYRPLLEEKDGAWQMMGLKDIARQVIPAAQESTDTPLPYEEYDRAASEQDLTPYDSFSGESFEEQQQRLEQAWTNAMLARAIEAWNQMP